jgi:hypothetical protein
MKLERLEVRLRPKNPIEQELIEFLKAQDGIYGGKNELMRECLRRGYTALKQKVERLPGTGDEVSMLDALAQTFASGEYGYRVVKIYLDARNQAKAGSNVQPSDGAVTASVATNLVQTATEPPEPPSGVPMSPPAHSPEQPDAPAFAGGAGEGAPKRKVDWTRMRGLAGSNGGKMVNHE